jgi:3-dehydroquinate synthase
VDAPFSVHHVHRLRFTHDVLDPTNATFASVLPEPCIEPGADEPSDVLAFVDAGVLEAWPDLSDRLERYAGAHPDRMRLCGPPVVVPGGETAKNDRAVFESAIAAIDGAGLCRQSYVTVIGGGAVLDAIGFAAATAHRGVRLIRMPTTTLSQADGGLGVKNGVNAFGKKNFLGTFAVPWAVINDLDFLETLSDRDHRAGFSEVVKVGLIKDADLFRRTAACAARLADRDAGVAHPLIRRSAELHLLHIVAGGDPFELTESRPLDFGHWSAHKIEQMTDFTIGHGAAVAIGVALDAVYSARSAGLAAEDAQAVLACLGRLGFDLYDDVLERTDELLEGLEEFREHLGGRLTITLLRGAGEPVDVHEIDRELVRQSIETLRDS